MSLSIKSRRGKWGFIPLEVSRPKAVAAVRQTQGGPLTGFTVVELLVAMSIFAIFLAVAFGVFVQAVKGQRELTRFMAVQNNAGLVLEQMMREMRTGYWFCSQPDAGISPCENPGSASLTFINHERQVVAYTLDAGAVKRNGVSLTSGAVQVNRLQFLVTQQRDVCVPPRITVLMGVELAGAGNVAPVNLETTVSSRVFPVDVRDAPLNVRSSCQI